jgi:isochorismate hydrolase
MAPPRGAQYGPPRNGVPAMTAVQRIVSARCCGVIVDVQGFFLAQVDKRLRARLKANTANFARLLGYYRIPLLVTLERPVDDKGGLPKEIVRGLSSGAKVLEKDFFDLTRDKTIMRWLAGQKRRQAILAGCETDVCVLQSCLGLLAAGYEVFVVEELIFSSARNTAAALAQMRDAGAVLTTYKSVYYELMESVAGPGGSAKASDKLGAFPEDLSDAAV